MDDQNLPIVSIEEKNLQTVAPSTLYVADSYEVEGSIAQHVNDAGRGDEVNSQDAIDKFKTSTKNTTQTETKKKKKKKKKQTKRKSAEVGEEQVDIIKNGHGKENQTVDEEKVTPKAKRLKMATSSTPSLARPRSSSGTAITWSTKDELTILRGLINFKKEKGVYDSSEFYESIKSELSQGTLIQVREKVRSLERKYRNGRQSHELKVFDLSRKYWGEIDAADDKDKDKEDETLSIAMRVVDVDKMNDCDGESKSEIAGILRRGLLEHFQREGFDPNWVEEQDMKDLENKFEVQKIAEANADLAKANFNESLYSCALNAHRKFGYHKES